MTWENDMLPFPRPQRNKADDRVEPGTTESAVRPPLDLAAENKRLRTVFEYLANIANWASPTDGDERRYDRVPSQIQKWGGARKIAERTLAGGSLESIFTEREED
jgi:hypothetical protein